MLPPCSLPTGLLATRLRSSFADAALKDGPSSVESAGFNEAVKKALADKKSPASREGAAGAVLAIVNAGAVKALGAHFH
jgi:elongation factor 3